MADATLCGIYEIVNRTNGKRYVGSAHNLKIRWRTHQWALRRDRHHSYRLQAAWRKHGAGAFEFNVLEHVTDASSLREREQRHIDQMKPAYNVSKQSSGGGAIAMSAAGRAKIAEANRRRTADAVAKTAAAHRGMKRSAETRARISAAMTGKKRRPRTFSPECMAVKHGSQQDDAQGILSL